MIVSPIFMNIKLNKKLNVDMKTVAGFGDEWHRFHQ